MTGVEVETMTELAVAGMGTAGCPVHDTSRSKIGINGKVCTFRFMAM
jgi:hypothetical protein